MERKSVSTVVIPIEQSWVIRPATTRWRRSLRFVSHAQILGTFLLGLRLLRDTWYLAREFYYDFLRTFRYTSAVLTANSRAKLSALITIGYHGIEKGLALPSPRPGFGREEIYLLMSRLERYITAFGVDETVGVAITVLNKYVEFSEKHENIDPDIPERLRVLSRSIPPASTSLVAGGTRIVLKDDFLRHARLDLADFFNSRASVRQYADEPVSMDDVVAAVDLARRTPSCCNRQPGRVWVFTDKTLIGRALRLQGGARGFSEEVPLLLLVTSDLACFQSPGERSQALVDGGMFAMSLVYGLHSRGLVTCCLNWAKRHAANKQLADVFGVPEQEAAIMFISVGQPKDQYTVAVSHRRPLEDVIRIVGHCRRNSERT